MVKMSKALLSHFSYETTKEMPVETPHRCLLELRLATPIAGRVQMPLVGASANHGNEDLVTKGQIHTTAKISLEFLAFLATS